MTSFRRSHSPAARGQGGFTLIEILIALSLLAALAAITMFAFNPSKSKGEILFSAMNGVAQAAERFALDTSCYPYSTNQLFDATAVSGSTNNSCGSDVSSTWNGPYLKTKPVNASGDILLPQISPTTDLAIGPANPTIGSGTSQYAVIASNVPESIALQAIRACSGGTATTDGSTGGNCHVGTASSGMNTIELVFAQ